MRDYVLTLLILGLLPVCVWRPWIGILVWYWFGLMNPHRLTWDFAYSMPFASWIGGATLVGAEPPSPADLDVIRERAAAVMESAAT